MSGLVTAIVGAGIAVATTTASFSQAAKQKRLKESAENKASKAMEEAKRKANVNYMDALSVKKEPYELQKDLLLSQGAAALEAGVEGETRGAAAVAGRIQAAEIDASEKLRTAMSGELTSLERLQAEEDARIRDKQVDLALGEVEGAQMAAADAEQASAAAVQQGLAGLTNATQQALGVVPLYTKKAGDLTSNYNAYRDTEVNNGNTPMSYSEWEGTIYRGNASPTPASSFIDPSVAASLQTQTTQDYKGEYDAWMKGNGYILPDGGYDTNAAYTYDEWVLKFKNK